MITDSCPCDHPNPTNQKFCCGDTTHFDLSWWAFNEIGKVEQGFMDVMYERLPSCPLASSMGINRDTCDSYYGIISEQVPFVSAAATKRGSRSKAHVSILACPLICLFICFQDLEQACIQWLIYKSYAQQQDSRPSKLQMKLRRCSTKGKGKIVSGWWG